MNIGIIGASGKSGQRLMEEALRQGHTVTAIVRDKSKITDTRVAVLQRDIFAITSEDMAEFDAVIDAFRAPQDKEEQHWTSMEHLIAVLEHLPDVRFLVVGGAGSLYVDAGKTERLMDTADFPPAFLPTASNMGKAFEALKASAVNWTYLSPAAFYDPDGPRTGVYKTGGDVLVVNDGGKSYVSYADFAIAMIDELTKKAHVRERFSVVSA